MKWKLVSSDQFDYSELTSCEAWLRVRCSKLVSKMKKLFRIFAIGCLGIVFLGASSQMASASCSSKPNIFGGSDTRCTDGSKLTAIRQSCRRL